MPRGWQMQAKAGPQRAAAGRVAADHLHRALRRHGVTYLQARAYHRPHGPLTSQRHWQAGGFVAKGQDRPGDRLILGLSETTARFHLDNARRKLGAVNRAHAVARYLAFASH